MEEILTDKSLEVSLLENKSVRCKSSAVKPKCVINFTLEIFLCGAELSVNSTYSGNPMHRLSMNWGQSEDPLCYLCLGGAVLAFLSFTQEVAGSRTSFNQKKHVVTEFGESH